ncbi:YggS family pyridoxal phosphate-dependent enzyme [Nocardia uniformis]|uniref:Pyridoxal phosphate homeostasis protein n=1 Tax=Nocardia uniformis TaxID=53432 RepID=A0A849C738_9NOCA|nr:YggS family pyridoxal phosphate-dependent enzyme [Nocardia uniformis]NNH72145.1 YggS family pyridoxal phosphate-dependent enzyme [Nocardia uniformis]
MTAESPTAARGSETTDETHVTARTAELSTNLASLTARIDAACRAVGREVGSVRLLPVTKFHPASDIEILYGLGCREFGESREQEATAKVAQLGHLSHVCWEFIGRLQRNKVKHVARWANTVNSVDSDRLAGALDAAVGAALEAEERTTPMRVLLQVSLDGDTTRGGVVSDDLPALADYVESSASLQLGGLMAIPPLGADPDREFARLAQLHTRLLTAHPQASELSAGMSSDLEAAVRHGSTCVRVGTALMGERPITSA